MSKLNSTPTAVITAIVLATSVGLTVQYLSSAREAGKSIASASVERAVNGNGAAVAATPAKGVWAASAPGRVEPRKGEIRIGTQTPGRVAEVLVQMNDRVLTGDLLARIDDEEVQTKLVAAEVETAVRKRERDAETVGRLAQDRRNADDAVAAADRALFQARRDLDRVFASRLVTPGTAAEDEVTKTRTAVAAAKDKAEQERQALRKIQGSAGMPLPTRLESALSTARAELLLAETAIERARVRAPSDGTLLQVTAKVGETVAPNPELTLAVLGDLTGLRVRAEVEERDVSKVRNGQKVVIRTDAFPGRDFAGTVTMLGQSLAPPRLSSRGPRRPTDVDALEVLVDVDGGTPLLPGMRTDIFFLPDVTAQSPAPAKAN